MAKRVSGKALRELRDFGIRDSRDGKPFYCKLCGLGFQEFGACEEPDCELESDDEARKRFEPA